RYGSARTDCVRIQPTLSYVSRPTADHAHPRSITSSLGAGGAIVDRRELWAPESRNQILSDLAFWRANIGVAFRW
ncbi:MAG: hypothetical protein AB7F99_18460, partial [Vicinamibacterales bacterium]